MAEKAMQQLRQSNKKNHRASQIKYTPHMADISNNYGQLRLIKYSTNET